MNMRADAVWQLLGTTNWVIEFVEKVFRECIFIEGSDSGPATQGQPESHKGMTVATLVRNVAIDDCCLVLGSALDNPLFLHLAHPFALGRLHAAVEHVKRFHDQVAKLNAKGENSHIAKDFLMDITGGSGVEIQLIGPLLGEILQDSKSLNSEPYHAVRSTRTRSHRHRSGRARPPAKSRSMCSRPCFRTALTQSH